MAREVIVSRDLKRRLDTEYARRNRIGELSFERPDPLFVAKRYNDASIALICALFGYGNAKAIVTFLERLDFTLLDQSEETIRRALRGAYYRFQNSDDVTALFIALRRLRQEESLKITVTQAYRQTGDIYDGLRALIEAIYSAYDYRSDGYRFLVGKIPPKQKVRASAYKRYMMFLRWMVRDDALDMGLWRGIDKRDLVIPLDTHTAAVSRRLGLLRRKSNDYKAALELTEALRRLDADDPLKYDFVLYRIGQEKMALD